MLDKVGIRTLDMFRRISQHDFHKYVLAPYKSKVTLGLMAALKEIHVGIGSPIGNS